MLIIRIDVRTDKGNTSLGRLNCGFMEQGEDSTKIHGFPDKSFGINNLELQGLALGAFDLGEWRNLTPLGFSGA
jgi:hypothetical protein